MAYSQNIQMILNEINSALNSVDKTQIERFVDDILSSDKVFLIGVGRVMLSLEAFAKRLGHLGIDAHCVGDITEPAMTDKSLLIVGSGSGCSIVPVAIAKKAKKIGGKVVHIGSNPSGDIKEYADYMVRIPVQTKLYLKDEVKSCQPMTSLFEQSLLIFGDAVAMQIIELKNIEMDKLWMFHANLE